jgi:hypothetical protein
MWSWKDSYHQFGHIDCIRVEFLDHNIKWWKECSLVWEGQSWYYYLRTWDRQEWSPRSKWLASNREIWAPRWCFIHGSIDQFAPNLSWNFEYRASIIEQSNLSSDFREGNIANYCWSTSCLGYQSSILDWYIRGYLDILERIDYITWIWQNNPHWPSRTVNWW